MKLGFADVLSTLSQPVANSRYHKYVTGKPQGWICRSDKG